MEKIDRKDAALVGEVPSYVFSARTCLELLPLLSPPQLETEIKKRDQLDSTRDNSPLIKANGATELITDGMDIQEVIETIIELFRERVPEEVWPTPSSS